MFTAGSGRTLDFADFAAETVAGIDVYKSVAPDRIEGGIGGSIDLRTRRPFDFAGDLRNSVDPALNRGSAGNPALRPVRGRNLDLAIEGYAGPAQSQSLTLFWKKVDGFVATLSPDEAHDGVSYSVSRPYNNDADIRGGLYEHGPLAVRLAYNWRSKFRSGATSVVGGDAFVIYTRGYGWLDASLGWRIGARVTVTLEGGNLLRTLRRSYHGVPTRPQSAWLNDRQIAAGLSVRY